MPYTIKSKVRIAFFPMSFLIGILVFRWAESEAGFVTASAEAFNTSALLSKVAQEPAPRSSSSHVSGSDVPVPLLRGGCSMAVLSA